MHMVKGGCRCGNISYVAEFSREIHAFSPRACDCGFCKSHRAAYASDKKGKLSLKIKSESGVEKFRQGSRIADFLVCKNCGSMVCVCYEEGGCVYGSINTLLADEHGLFGDSKEMHLSGKSDEERVKRWKESWFSDVLIEYEGA